MIGAFRLIYPTEEKGVEIVQQNLKELIQRIISLVKSKIKIEQ